jgi:hypothetical protein
MTDSTRLARETYLRCRLADIRDARKALEKEHNELYNELLQLQLEMLRLSKEDSND